MYICLIISSVLSSFDKSTKSVLLIGIALRFIIFAEKGHLYNLPINSVKISSSKMNSDIHASADYRANMVRTFAKKAVDAC